MPKAPLRRLIGLRDVKSVWLLIGPADQIIPAPSVDQVWPPARLHETVQLLMREPNLVPRREEHAQIVAARCLILCACNI
jgi:hypothetical protein